MQSTVVLTKTLAKKQQTQSKHHQGQKNRGKGTRRRTRGVRKQKSKRKGNHTSISKNKSKIIARSHARTPVECCGWGRCQVTSYVSSTHGRQPQHSQEQAQEQVSTRKIKSNDHRKSNEPDLAMKGETAQIRPSAEVSGGSKHALRSNFGSSKQASARRARHSTSTSAPFSHP